MSSARNAARTLLVLVLVGSLGAYGPSATAEEEPAPPPVETGSGAEPIDDEVARAKAKTLGKVARKRQVAEALALLDEVGFVSHEDLHKPLVKLLRHDLPQVSIRAAELLGAQRVEEERDRAKLAKSVWKSGWGDRANKDRPAVRTASLLAWASLTGQALDDRDAKEVIDLWRWSVGNPNPDYAPALIDICRYVRIAKDKRLCRLLAEEIDEPGATAVNSPTNPPASWWEARWKLWKPVHAEAVEALEVLTGQSFKSTEQARAWFEANEKEFGFRW